MFDYVGEVTNESRIENQAGMILNAQNNTTQDSRNISDLYEIYKSIVSDLAGSKLSKTEAAPILNSIQNSKDFFEENKCLSSLMSNLKNGDNKSFLIVPVTAVGHLYAGMIRKDSDGDFSFTMINKGYRGDKSIITEYFFSKDRGQILKNLIDSVTYTNSETMYSPHKRSLMLVDKVYEKFEKQADAVISHNIKSRHQKTGNCYLKELEFAIKCALATKNTSFKTMSLLNKHPKWPIETIDIHKIYIQKLLDKYKYELPKESKSKIGGMLEKYTQNKNFRDLYSHETTKYNLSPARVGLKVKNFFKKASDRDEDYGNSGSDVVTIHKSKLTKECLDKIMGPKDVAIQLKKLDNDSLAKINNFVGDTLRVNDQVYRLDDYMTPAYHLGSMFGNEKKQDINKNSYNQNTTSKVFETPDENRTSKPTRTKISASEIELQKNNLQQKMLANKRTNVSFNFDKV